MKMKLIEEKIEIKFSKFIVSDFEAMNTLVRWCDSYVRNTILAFHFLKEFLSFQCFFERDKEIPQYISSIKFYFSKPSHRLKMEDEKIKEFKEFLLKKFKRANPKIVKWDWHNTAQK